MMGKLDDGGMAGVIYCISVDHASYLSPLQSRSVIVYGWQVSSARRSWLRRLICACTCDCLLHHLVHSRGKWNGKRSSSRLHHTRSSSLAHMRHVILPHELLSFPEADIVCDLCARQRTVPQFQEPKGHGSGGLHNGSAEGFRVF
jgi:hypothetical protein